MVGHQIIKDKKMNLKNALPRAKETAAFIMQSATWMLKNLFPSITEDKMEQALKLVMEPDGLPRNPLTRKEVGKILSISLATVNRYMNRGLLRKIAFSPRAVRIDPLSVQELLNHGRSNYQPVIK